MGLFHLAFAGGSFVLIGAWESLISTSNIPLPPDKSISSSLPPNPVQRFSTVTLISAGFLSLLFMFDAFLSFFDAFTSNDKMGSSLQLQVLSISLLFLLFSLLGLFNNLSTSISFPYSLINLIALFAFIEEFLLFYLHLKDSSGIENRYFDLMLVPIAICVFSTIIELKNPCSDIPRLARGLGLILQGTWFVQMGLSFYTTLIAHNCSLQHKSRGNYTIKCKSHMDSHRGGAIAVLLFNCHLAFLVAIIAEVYSVVGWRLFYEGDYTNYRPLGGEIRRMENQGQFMLDSDSDDGGIDVIKQEEMSASKRGNGAAEMGVNGYGSHPY